MCAEMSRPPTGTVHDLFHNPRPSATYTSTQLLCLDLKTQAANMHFLPQNKHEHSATDACSFPHMLMFASMTLHPCRKCPMVIMMTSIIVLVMKAKNVGRKEGPICRRDEETKEWHLKNIDGFSIRGMMRY